MMELGHHIALLRDNAGLTQAELAKRVTWSAAMLSRTEAGERSLDEDELSELLNAIGTAEARSLQQTLQRKWTALPRPPIGHEDSELLWEAEKVISDLRVLRASGDVKSAFERRLAEYENELAQTATRLLQTEYQVALLGSTGVGKSTAICRVTGLEVPGKLPGTTAPVLEAGGGGITVCEVHLRQGSNYGVVIEPRTEEEIRQDAAEYAEFLLQTKEGSVADEQEAADPDSLGISKEIARAVRHMAGFKTRRETAPDGRQLRIDEARELAARVADVRSLSVEILARMELHKRDRRDIWYLTDTGREPLVWLKETFEQINNGRHPEFSLPRRIEVVVPFRLIEATGFSIRFIDTKGIDQTAAREDLESFFDNTHTLALLCSRLFEAPATPLQQLLKRALEAGIRGLSTKAGILCLPQPGEAFAVKDEDGVPAEDVQQGYNLKGEDVLLRLQHLGLRDMAVGFFNARDDNPDILRKFIISRVEILRGSHREQLQKAISGALSLLENYQKAQVQEIVRQAAKRLKTWLAHNRSVSAENGKLYDSLFSAMGSSYASTVRASVRRDGNWPNLDYAHHLGFGTRRIAATTLQPKATDFKAIAENLLQDADMADAHDLVQQSTRVMEVALDELLRKMQLAGHAIYTKDLKEDRNFWQSCVNEWGQGPGYKDRVRSRNKTWFDDQAQTQQETYLRTLVQSEWVNVLDRVAALMPAEN